MRYIPSTTVEFIRVERLLFDKHRGIYTHYPKVVRRFDKHGVSGMTTCFTIGFGGRLLRDINRTDWEIGYYNLAAETDFYKEDDRCPNLHLGYPGHPQLSAIYLLSLPKRWSRLNRFVHNLAHDGFNIGKSYAKAWDIAVPYGTIESTVGDRDNAFRHHFRIFYSFDWGEKGLPAASEKLMMAARLEIAVLEGDPVALLLNRERWKELLQNAASPLAIRSDPVWQYFSGIEVAEISADEYRGIG